jgi:hypothetical protein
MKNVNIMHVCTGSFFSEGIEYSFTGGSANTRILCYKKDDPTKSEIQFSSYSTVQVSDEDAIAIKRFIIYVLEHKKQDIKELERDLKSLEKQGVKIEEENIKIG